MKRKAQVARNFSCHIETGGRFKVTDSHVHCKCGNISKTVQTRDVATADH